MEFVNYKCLESLLIYGTNIATESARPEFPINSEVRKIFNKINVYSKPTELSYYYISDIIVNASHPEKLTNSDIMKIHKCFYNEEESLAFFAPSEVPEDVAIVKKYKPIPIYSYGNGDHYCVIATGEIKEYIHDSNKIFDASYSQNFKNYTEWFNKWYMRNAPEYEYQTATESSNSRIDSNKIKSYVIKRIMQLVPFIINDKNASSINVKLLVSKSAYSLDFNATVNKIKYNAMKMVDDGMIKEKDFNTCAEDIAKFVRKQSSFNPSKVNKYSFSFMPDGAILNDGEITTGKSKFIDLTGDGPIDDNIQY